MKFSKISRCISTVSVGILLLLLVVDAPAASIKGQVTYKQYDPIVLKAQDITSANAQYLWDVDGGAKFVEVGGTIYVWAPPGKYRVSVTAIDFDSKKVERARFNFVVEGKPVPPDPGPGPVPPDPGPGPTPDPAPIPVQGFRVLIVYESADLTDSAKMPATQVNALTSKTLHEYLDSKCVAGPKVKEWRIWDKDENGANEAKHWQDAMKRPRKSLPWIIISDGKTGYEGPLPVDAQKIVDLLKKYGG